MEKIISDLFPVDRSRPVLNLTLCFVGFIVIAISTLAGLYEGVYVEASLLSRHVAYLIISLLCAGAVFFVRFKTDNLIIQFAVVAAALIVYLFLHRILGLNNPVLEWVYPLASIVGSTIADGAKCHTQS